MSSITTHVLDLARGRPAPGIRVRLERRDLEKSAAAWLPVGADITDPEGRARDLVPKAGTILPGTYRLVFATGAYFRAAGIATFYPEVIVSFEIADATGRYHLPLLLSPFGYSTYRGS